MLIIFQILAVLAIAVAAFFMLRGGGVRHQAVRRILMLLFIIAAASSVFLPQIWTKLAHLFGIARGADLLLYFLVLTFLGFVATTYRRFRNLEQNVTELARRMAIDHAERPEHLPSPVQPETSATDASATDASAADAPHTAAPDAPGTGAPAEPSAEE